MSFGKREEERSGHPGRAYSALRPPHLPDRYSLDLSVTTVTRCGTFAPTRQRTRPRHPPPARPDPLAPPPPRPCALLLGAIRPSNARLAANSRRKRVSFPSCSPLSPTRPEAADALVARIYAHLRPSDERAHAPSCSTTPQISGRRRPLALAPMRRRCHRSKHPPAFLRSQSAVDQAGVSSCT